MASTVSVNGLTLCHRLSDGVSTATLPDVCKTPGRGDVPYPNVAYSRDLAKGTTTVSADGADMCANYGSEFTKSTGDEPGTDGGVTSKVNTREATWITYSFDVTLEGRGACRLTDKMFHNRRNTVNAGGELQAPEPRPPSDPRCARLYQLIYDLIWRQRGPTPPGGRPDGMKGLAWRWQEFAENRGGWTAGRRVDGHAFEYQKQRQVLRDRYDEWKARGCDDDDLPPGTPEYASDQLPQLGPGAQVAPNPISSEFRQHLRTLGLAAAGTAGVIVTIIVISRIIRLFPPLLPLQLSPI